MRFPGAKTVQQALRAAAGNAKYFDTEYAVFVDTSGCYNVERLCVAPLGVCVTVVRPDGTQYEREAV